METLEDWEDLGQCLMGALNGSPVVTDALIYLDREAREAMTKDGNIYKLGKENVKSAR